jgi:hypothetical protein
VKQALIPQVAPYYDAYAAPYANLAIPYYRTVDDKVFVPARVFVTTHGGPRIAQAQAFAKAQWKKTVQPQLAKGQVLLKGHYDQSIAPYVSQASVAVAPYYDIARTNALQTYHELILPSYQYVQPYASHGYATASDFTSGVAIPSAYWAWNKTYVFLDGTVWPQLRVIYIENVEPQLVRIGQRLGRYKDNSSSIPESSSAR